jgi:hypothetical protein
VSGGHQPEVGADGAAAQPVPVPNLDYHPNAVNLDTHAGIPNRITTGVTALRRQSAQTRHPAGPGAPSWPTQPEIVISGPGLAAVVDDALSRPQLGQPVPGRHQLTAARCPIIAGRLWVMDQERNTAPQSDVIPSQGESMAGAMQGGFDGWTGWSEERHTATDIRECTDQHCMNVEVNCGFQGWVPDSPLSQSAAVSDELRAAWRAKLASEGKATSGARSLRDVIFPADR